MALTRKPKRRPAREEARWAIARKIAGEIAAEFGATDADREWAASVLGLDADDWRYGKMPGKGRQRGLG
jgi:hypothetical protein